MDKTFKIEASGDFPFSFYIEKAVPTGTEEVMSIKGVASTVNIDHDNERMSAESLVAMAKIINSETVPLRLEHQKDDNAIIGNVNKAWVDSRNQLWIEADLDKSHPGSPMLYKALKAGAKLGLSVGGRVKHAVREFSEAAGKMVKTFYNVVLDEVSVTSRPANYDAWLVSKSIIDKEEDGAKFVDSPLHKEFIFETLGYDYMQEFAKSIPDTSWKRVDINSNNINKDMSKELEKKESEATTEETKEKAVEETTETKEKAMDETTSETKEKAEGKKEDETETSFKSMVTKALEGLTAAVMGMKKTSGGTEETTIMEDKTKKAEETSETKEKAETKETETSEKNTSEYQIGTMKSILKRIEDLSKAVDETTETKEKAESKEEETTEKSQDLDSFVDAIEKSIDSLAEKFTKGGKRTIGLNEMIVNAIRNDAEIQKEIQSMMKEPGFKKSMQFGVPMMRTKDGKAYRLTAQNMEEDVEKSKDHKGKSFKEVYNKEFSSSARAEE